MAKYHGMVMELTAHYVFRKSLLTLGFISDTDHCVVSLTPVTKPGSDPFERLSRLHSQEDKSLLWRRHSM